MGVSNEAKNVIPLKFLRKIKNLFSSCELNPGTHGMRVKYDLLSTIGENLIFNKPKECIQKSKFNDSKCSFCYHGYVFVHNAIVMVYTHLLPWL
jgi:hypothetical protein